MNEETQSAVIEDCIKVDKELSSYIEECQWMPENFTLEVSSPGLYRKIKTAQHYKLSIDKRIKVYNIPNLWLDKFKISEGDFKFKDYFGSQNRKYVKIRTYQVICAILNSLLFIGFFICFNQIIIMNYGSKYFSSRYR